MAKNEAGTASNCLANQHQQNHVMQPPPVCFNIEQQQACSLAALANQLQQPSGHQEATNQDVQGDIEMSDHQTRASEGLANQGLQPLQHQRGTIQFQEQSMMPQHEASDSKSKVDQHEQPPQECDTSENGKQTATRTDDVEQELPQVSIVPGYSSGSTDKKPTTNV